MRSFCASVVVISCLQLHSFVCEFLSARFYLDMRQHIGHFSSRLSPCVVKTSIFVCLFFCECDHSFFVVGHRPRPLGDSRCL